MTPDELNKGTKEFGLSVITLVDALQKTHIAAPRMTAKKSRREQTAQIENRQS